MKCEISCCFGCVLFIHIACLCKCVLFYFCVICLYVYAYTFKPIAGVPFDSVGILRTTFVLRTTCMRF